MRIVVIGAGIVGASCALELLRDGHEVTVIEPAEAGGPQAASYGQGCWISPASVVPMSMPGLWRQVPGYLLNSKGPLVIRWRYILKLMPWLIRFLRAGSTVSKVEATASALALLLGDAPQRHQALAAEIGRPDLVCREGLLYVYADRKALEVDALGWKLRRMTGVSWRELDRAELAEREPRLAERYGLGLLVEDGAHCIDPGSYVARIMRVAIDRGAALLRARATGFVFEKGRLIAVKTDVSQISCDRVVIAAGIWSKTLARMCGDAIPLESERGYHGEIIAPEVGPVHPVMPADGRMANTPTARGLRLSGQVELATIDAPPDWSRVDVLMAHAKGTYPGLAGSPSQKMERWMGHRPSTPDGLPVIGPSSRFPDVIYAFGHGHVGFASGPVTGRIVADQISGRAMNINIGVFSPRRFR